MQCCLLSWGSSGAGAGGRGEIAPLGPLLRPCIAGNAVNAAYLSMHAAFAAYLSRYAAFVVYMDRYAANTVYMVYVWIY